MKKCCLDLVVVNPESQQKVTVPGIFDENCMKEFFESVVNAISLGFDVIVDGDVYED